MIRTPTLSLRPTPEQAQALLATIKAFNAACHYASSVAWERREFNNYRLRSLCYAEVRARFGLPAQLAQHAITRVAHAYRLNRQVKAEFRPLGAVTYDPRVMRLLGLSVVSMTLLSGREKIPLSTGGYHAARLGGAALGEADLCYQPEKGRFRLHLSLKEPTPPTQEPDGVLGVDVGIQNVAATSDGEVFSGGPLRGLRRRHLRVRARLQRKFTRSARRLLKKRRRKERRFATHINHCISKRIIATAKGTGRGIALEDLLGIRDRIPVPRRQRALLHSWPFHQLRQFILYKAEAAGVPVFFVDAKNTSRTCPACGHCEKGNRPRSGHLRL